MIAVELLPREILDQTDALENLGGEAHTAVGDADALLALLHHDADGEVLDGETEDEDADAD